MVVVKLFFFLGRHNEDKKLILRNDDYYSACLQLMYNKKRIIKLVNHYFIYIHNLKTVVIWWMTFGSPGGLFHY